MNTQSRAVACFLGLAIGDALGAPAEFESRGNYEPISGYRSGGPWNLPEGYWTDDTSMAICLAESILAHNSINQQDLLERFSRWYQHGENSSTGSCFDIGNTTVLAVRRFVQTGIYEPALNRPDLSGNGSIMRLAPVATRWWNRADMLFVTSRKQSLTTHGSDECVDACEQLATLLGAAIRGEPVHEQLHRELGHISVDRVPNSGRASHTLLAARWSVATSSSFEESVLKAVNLGGDTDTIGAVAGSIAGAIWGVEAIPAAWLDGLYQQERLTQLAEQLYLMSQQ